MERRKNTGNGIIRMIFVAVALILQVVWILLRIKLLNDYSDTIAAITTLLSVAVVLKLNSKYTNSAMKMPWVMLILVFPVMGLCMYLLFELLGDPGVGRRLRTVRKHLNRNDADLVSDQLNSISRQDPAVEKQFRYLWNTAGYPVYTNTRVDYYPEARMRSLP